MRCLYKASISSPYAVQVQFDTDTRCQPPAITSRKRNPVGSQLNPIKRGKRAYSTTSVAPQIKNIHTSSCGGKTTKKKPDRTRAGIRQRYLNLLLISCVRAS